MEFVESLKNMSRLLPLGVYMTLQAITLPRDLEARLNCPQWVRCEEA